jgi:hypothetical protein
VYTHDASTHWRQFKVLDTNNLNKQLCEEEKTIVILQLSAMPTIYSDDDGCQCDQHAVLMQPLTGCLQHALAMRNPKYILQALVVTAVDRIVCTHTAM